MRSSKFSFSFPLWWNDFDSLKIFRWKFFTFKIFLDICSTSYFILKYFYVPFYCKSLLLTILFNTTIFISFLLSPVILISRMLPWPVTECEKRFPPNISLLYFKYLFSKYILSSEQISFWYQLFLMHTVIWTSFDRSQYISPVFPMAKSNPTNVPTAPGNTTLEITSCANIPPFWINLITLLSKSYPEIDLVQTCLLKSCASTAVPWITN